MRNANSNRMTTIAKSIQKQKLKQFNIFRENYNKVQRYQCQICLTENENPRQTTGAPYQIYQCHENHQLICYQHLSQQPNFRIIDNGECQYQKSEEAPIQFKRLLVCHKCQKVISSPVEDHTSLECLIANMRAEIRLQNQ